MSYGTVDWDNPEHIKLGQVAYAADEQRHIRIDPATDEVVMPVPWDDLPPQSQGQYIVIGLCVEHYVLERQNDRGKG